MTMLLKIKKSTLPNQLHVGRNSFGCPGNRRLAGIGIEPADGSIWTDYAIKIVIAIEEKLQNILMAFNKRALHVVLLGTPNPA